MSGIIEHKSLRLIPVWEDLFGKIYSVTDDRGRYLGNVWPEDAGCGSVVWFASNANNTRSSNWEDDFQDPTEAAEWCAIQSPYRLVLEVA